MKSLKMDSAPSTLTCHSLLLDTHQGVAGPLDGSAEEKGETGLRYETLSY